MHRNGQSSFEEAFVKGIRAEVFRWAVHRFSIRSSFPLSNSHHAAHPHRHNLDGRRCCCLSGTGCGVRYIVILARSGQVLPTSFGRNSLCERRAVEAAVDNW